MTLSKLNRELTFYGKKVLEKTRRPGLKELMRIAGCSEISSEAIGFQIGPRLNAGGRMESAEISLSLLMSDSKVEAVKLAEQLNNLNSERRNEQILAMQEIEEERSEELARDVIVVSGEWHEGVLGIIAGRLVEKYHKPAFVLSKVSMKDIDGDGISDIYKGSGRSFGDFNLADAIRSCASICGGGGHAMACGVKILPEMIEDFADEVNAYYNSLGLKNQEKSLEIDGEFSESDLRQFDEELLEDIAQLEPFGNGNEEPTFELFNVEIVEARAVGKEGKHLRMVVRDEMNTRMTLIAFSAPEEWLNTQVGEKVSVVVRLMKNEWNGRVFVEGRILNLSI